MYLELNQSFGLALRLLMHGVYFRAQIKWWVMKLIYKRKQKEVQFRRHPGEDLGERLNAALKRVHNIGKILYYRDCLS